MVLCFYAILISIKGQTLKHKFLDLMHFWGRREICSRKAQMISNWITKAQPQSLHITSKYLRDRRHNHYNDLTYRIFRKYSMNLDSKSFQTMPHWCLVTEKRLQVIFSSFRVWQERKGTTQEVKNKKVTKPTNRPSNFHLY